MPGSQISKTEFKARALKYFRQIEASGEPVIVTDHSKPTLEVRPYRELERDPLAGIARHRAALRRTNGANGC